MSFKSVKNTCAKARQDALPKAAKTVEEIVQAFESSYTYETYGLTHRNNAADKSPFYRGAFRTPGGSFCVFASTDTIRAITKHVAVSDRKIYIDGTFKTCPAGEFKQIVILFAEVFGHVSDKIFGCFFF